MTSLINIDIDFIYLKSLLTNLLFDPKNCDRKIEVQNTSKNFRMENILTKVDDLSSFSWFHPDNQFDSQQIIYLFLVYSILKVRTSRKARILDIIFTSIGLYQLNRRN